MVQLTERAVGKVREIMDSPGAQARRTADRGGRRRLLRIQLFDGLREPAQHAGQDLQLSTV